MELLSEFRSGYGHSVKYYRRPESAWVYWERWEWRTPTLPDRRFLVAGWFTPIGLVLGIVTLLVALVGSGKRSESPRWVHVEAGWCDPYAFEQILAMSS